MKYRLRALSEVILISFLFLNFSAHAEAEILNRKVTVKVLNQTLGKTLNIISETAKFNFSYSNHVINTKRLVTVHAEDRTVKEVLDQLFENKLTYQQIGNHLVLQKKIMPRPTARQNTNEAKKSYDWTINGYIRDVYTGEGLSQVSLYNGPSLNTTISGDFGYYKLEINSKSNDYSVKISHPDYRDTIISLKFPDGGVEDININLVPKVLPIEETDEVQEILDDSSVIDSDSLDQSNIDMQDTAVPKLAWHEKVSNKLKAEETGLGKWIVGTYQKAINKNIRDTFQRDWQVTLVPPIGSNGPLSGLVENKFSFNVLAGYNGGVNGVEFGGLANILKRDMKGAQFGGLVNVVGGSVTGAQFGGFANQNFGYAKGFQAAGFYNMNMNGASLAQFAGFANINRGDFDGFQAAGFTNISSGKVRGVQTAGFLNLARRVDGGQISGFLNIAKKVRGFQIGLINIADSVDGFAIGVLNFIKNGLHQLEVSGNELNQLGLAYRSGSGKFYSNVAAEIVMPVRDTGGNLFSYGFSIGYRKKMTNWLYYNVDIGSRHLVYEWVSNHLNLHNRLNMDLEFKVFKGFSIFGGGSLSHRINDTLDPNYENVFKNLGSENSLWSYESRFGQRVWWGWRFGVRLF